MIVRPSAFGYLRLHAADPPEAALAMTAELVAYAEKEQLSLGEVFTDLFDPPAGEPERAGFCALMDALRLDDAQAVVILTAEQLSRRPAGFMARRTIIESEGVVRLLVIHSGYDR